MDAAKQNEQVCGVDARLELRGDGGGGTHRSFSDRLNELRAATLAYRKSHLKQQHIYRYFEIGAKSHFQEAMEMEPLTDDEKTTLVALEAGVTADEAALIRRLMEADGGKAASSLLPSDPCLHWQILLLQHKIEAEQMVIAAAGGEGEETGAGVDEEGGAPLDMVTALKRVRDDFLFGNCHGLTAVPDSTSLNAVQKIKLDVFWALCTTRKDKPSIARFDFTSLAESLTTADEAEPLDPANVFRLLERADGGEVGKAYTSLHAARSKALRLARFRHLALRELEAEEQARVDWGDRHVLTRELEGSLRKAFESYARDDATRVEGLADLLGPPDAPDNYLKLLQNGATFVSTEEHALRERNGGAGEALIAPWIDAHNRMASNRYADARQKGRDVELRDRIKAKVESMDPLGKVGLSKPSYWQQLAHIGKMLIPALELLGLALDFQPPLEPNGGGGDVRRPIDSVTVAEPSFKGLHLADVVMLYCPEMLEHVPAAAYRERVNQHRHEEELARDALGLSPQSTAATRGARTPASQRRAPPVLAPPGKLERYDAHGVRTLRDSLFATEGARAGALKIVQKRLSEAMAKCGAAAAGSAERQRQATQVAARKAQRRSLLRACDMLNVLKVLAALPDEDGLLVQRVPYHQKLGYARQVASGTLIDATDLDDDPAEAAALRWDREHSTRAMRRAVCYQGMHADLRPICGGAFLHDVDIVKCFPTVLLNHARRMDLLDNVPTLVRFLGDPDTFLAGIVSFHRLGAGQGDEAKMLLNSLICGKEYRAWLAERGLVERNDDVREFEREVDYLFGSIFQVDAERVQEVRARLERERLTDGLSERRRAERVAGIERSVRALWLQNEENEVLCHIERLLANLGWVAMALVYDGLMVERRADGSVARALFAELGDDAGALREVERRLSTEFDWRIQLKEKPLHGMQAQPVHSVVKANEVVEDVLGSECCICLEQLRPPPPQPPRRVRPLSCCSKYFHADCLAHALAQNAHCPLCRAPAQ